MRLVSWMGGMRMRSEMGDLLVGTVHVGIWYDDFASPYEMRNI